MASPKNLIKLPKNKFTSPFSNKFSNRRNGGSKNRLNAIIKTIAVYALIGLAVLIFMSGFSGNTQTGSEIPLSQVISEIKEGKVEKISLEGEKVLVKYVADAKDAVSRKEAGESIYKVLESAGADPSKVNIEIKDTSWQQNWVTIIGTILPILLMVGFFFFIFRQAKDGAQGIFSFGQSRARLFTKDQPQIKFTDVAGVDDAKKELEEVVDFLKNPGKYKEIGARTPKGVLLVGPPGCGKTLISRAIAGEAGVPFYSIAGSEFMEMLVGVGAARVRDMFATAKKNAPAIIFIDEIESIGRMRGMGMSGGHDEREQTLNQILVEMDGFAPNESAIVIAASVTGDTPILIKKEGKVTLMPIGDFVDQFYGQYEAGQEKRIEGFEALGFDKGQTNKSFPNNLYFGNSAFKKVRGVYRHKVSEIYEIEYSGGKIQATGNHSVFIRSSQGIRALPVSDLKSGNILVDLPFKANRTQKARRELRYHNFSSQFNLELPLKQNTDLERVLMQNHQLVLSSQGIVSQQSLALQIGISQTTVGNWQRNLFLPRSLSEKYFKHILPKSVKVDPELCRLLGYYTAEGYARKGLDFCFAEKEVDLREDVKQLMRRFFGIIPDKERRITKNAVNIVYNASQLTNFFIDLCGKGAHYKHVPSFLFQSPKEYFLEYLKGVILGDGYITKDGDIEITSVSQQLILELNWLCRMHGFKATMRDWIVKAGRTIGNGKPLPQTHAYRLMIGKHSNPFGLNFDPNNNFATLPRIKSIKKLPFDGFVYDFCGMDNEAFFGGKSPILLHNTNRPDLLDPALVRPGRFDRRVMINLPDLKEREQIIELHMKGKPFTKDVDIERLARRTVGFSGADLANMLNEAAILAAREAKKVIDNRDLEEAATKVKMGPQRKRMQSERDRTLAAYHEGGHAVVGHNLPLVDPVHRISIVSRGMSGGHTMFPPTEDRSNETKSRLLQQIATALGGRAAEEIIFDDVSTGATNDLQVASAIAREMVTQYGMSDLGNINIKPSSMFGAWRGEEGEQISESLQSRVDDEVKKIIDKAYKLAKEILIKNRTRLDRVAKALLEKETLDTEEFEKIVGKKKSAS